MLERVCRVGKGVMEMGISCREDVKQSGEVKVLSRTFFEWMGGQLLTRR
jgi:hypothetical protein